MTTVLRKKGEWKDVKVYIIDAPFLSEGIEDRISKIERLLLEVLNFLGKVTYRFLLQKK